MAIWSFVGSEAALAQATGDDAPARYINADANGVDVNDGSFNFSIVEGSIGSGEGALSIVRNYGKLGLSDNLPSRLVRYTLNGQRRVRLQFGNITATFSMVGGSLVPDNADGSSIIEAPSGASYTYVGKDGSRISYTSQPLAINSSVTSSAPSQCADQGSGLCYLQPTQIIKPSGLKIDFTWKTALFCTSINNFVGSGCFTTARIVNVQSDAGYVMTPAYDFNPTEGTSATLVSDGYGWNNRKEVVFSNTKLTSSTYPRVTYQTGRTYVNNVLTEYTETVQDTAAREWRFTRSPAGELRTIRRPGSSTDTTVVTRDGGGDITSVLRDGVTTSYNRVVGAGQVTTTVTNALSQVTTIVSNSVISRPLQVTDALNRTTSYAYDTAGRPTLMTMPEGNAVSTAYDARGNPITVTAIAKPGSGLANIVTSAEYPASCFSTTACNKPTATIDARLARTEYSYDQVTGLPLTITAPAVGGVNPKATFTYETIGGVSMLTKTSVCRTQASCDGAADEVRTTIQYDTNLQPTTISTGAGDGSLVATELYAYDYRGNRVSVDGPMLGTADTTTFRYDAARQLVGVTGPDPDGTGPQPNRAQATFYNVDGTVAEVWQGTVAGRSDSAWSAFADQYKVVSRYDANARKISVRLNKGTSSYGLTNYTYDALGRPICTAVRMNPGGWNAGTANACVLHTEGSFGPDRATRQSYDAAGQPTTTVMGYASTLPITVSTLTYTPNGKVQTAKDGNNNLTTYSYDGQDRPVKTQYPDPTNGTVSSATDFESFAYDPNGNVTDYTLRGGAVIHYSYDVLDRVSFKDVGDAALNVAFGYDLVGNPLYARYGNASGAGITSKYDALGRVTETVDTLAGVDRKLSYGYDLAGRRTQMTYPDGYVLDYTRDRVGAVTLMSTPTLAPAPDLFAFSYTDFGQLARVGRGKGAGGTTLYGYDTIGRLTSLAHDLFTGRTESNADTNDVAYTIRYNPAFPNFQITGVDTSNPLYTAAETVFTSTSTINGLNQLKTKGQRTYTNDVRGNMATATSTSSGVLATQFSYDLEGHLLTARNPDASVYRYGYGPLGRLARSERDGTPSTLARFVYDGDDMVAEYDSAGTMTRRYIHGPGIDQPLLEERDPGSTKIRQNLFPDVRGSIVAMGYLEGGALQAKVNKYDTEGFEGASSGTAWINTGRFGYTGQARLPETSLTHYKARTYAPLLGRFLQPDPIGYAGGMNMYAYVGADSVNKVDPSGLATVLANPAFTTNPLSDDQLLGDIIVTAQVSIPSLSGMDLLTRDVAASAVPQNVIPAGAGAISFSEAEKVATRIASDELKRTQRITREYRLGGHNDLYDAERHARWVYRMAMAIGSGWAGMFATGHEFEEMFGQPLIEMRMDLSNNALGLQAALNGSGIPNRATLGLVYIYDGKIVGGR